MSKLIRNLPKINKTSETQIQKQNCASRRAERAGVLDAVLSAGALRAPELRPVSGSRGSIPTPTK